ncbi:DUF4287 domain-containing protein [Candidatus Phycosocius spiralis]|uniref:DUF4287 domain-containing protein n=1 Tax=Candidatus Phycosocius spiralis TaxID=2815099 RepID=A0ABQ4PW13_9PROT|nr:DUF4287 domain-containing protein [Candidatus Phycosocius spiralis]GIU67193.1 hypothetical protein PsB1_1347 [Candidatus Phycosocius spiralis]
MNEAKIKGPASYFPAIEKQYGRPIAEWKSLVRAARPAKHMQLVSMLKEQYGMGHGHANAIVAYCLSEGDSEVPTRGRDGE